MRVQDAEPNEKARGGLAMILSFQEMPSPIGPLIIVAEPTHLRAVIFKNGWTDYRRSCATNGDSLQDDETRFIKKAMKQLNEYFAGKRTAFDLPYKLGGTAFQNKVWNALANIPYGKTITYKSQAEAIAKPKAMRAVGGTNGRNPICIILPCHRVIGSSGKLTGYGGGLDKKEFLLRLEGIAL
jgi:O-6-methylguanine DNA methyltransferase